MPLIICWIHLILIHNYKKMKWYTFQIFKMTFAAHVWIGTVLKKPLNYISIFDGVDSHFESSD